MYAMADRDIHRAGIFVQARRGELRMTQEQLAAESHVDEKTIRTLESGTHWPWPRNRTAIEQALGWETLTLERIAAGGEPSPPRAMVDLPGLSLSDLDLSALSPKEQRDLIGAARLLAELIAKAERDEGQRPA